MANTVETMTDPRSALPNVFTDITAREVDFVSRFTDSIEALRDILGIARPIKKENGTKLVSYTASVNLEDGAVPAGAVIPYSKATVEESLFGELSIKKYAKAVTIEDVALYGEEVAVQKTDDAFLKELQSDVTDTFYNSLKTNSSAITPETPVDSFQMAIAMAIGSVKDKFKKMRKNSTDIVVFVNTMDVYKYLGATEISIQSQFGIDYVQNFLGATTMIITSDIPEGKVIAVPAENLILYYVDPSTQFSKLGLVYTTDGDTNLIGFHAQGNYGTAVGESFAVLGMNLWYEYADGVAIYPFGNSSSDDGEDTNPEG